MKKTFLLPLIAISVFSCAGNRVSHLSFINDIDPVIYSGSTDDLNSEIHSLVLIFYRDASYSIEIQYSADEEELISEGKGSYTIRNNKIVLIPADSLPYEVKYIVAGSTLESQGETHLNLIKNENRLYERHWKLAWLNGQSMDVSINRERDPYVRFKLLNNRIFGSGGCNRFAGIYETTDKQILISRIISTKMACLEVNYENDFFRALESSTEYNIAGDTLILMNDGHVNARFLNMAPSSN